MSDSELYAAAVAARRRSYSPYSHFSVGAALLCSDGSVYTGCNIESSVFSPSVCAERVAIFKAVSEGRRDFTAIAVAGGKEELDGDALGDLLPCGVCRQVMVEFCGGDFRVITKNGWKPLSSLLDAVLPI